MDDKRNFQWGGGPSTLFEGSQPISQYKINGPHKGSIYFRAGKGSRTLDIDLGKVALYQLSYSRIGVALI